jgi:methyl-accepting chemotaxis protein
MVRFISVQDRAETLYILIMLLCYEVENMPTIELNGKSVNVNYDIAAQLDTEQMLFTLSNGMNKRQFLDIVENIGDTREIVSLILQGVNGYNRLENIDQRLNYEQVAKMLDDHLKMIGQNAKTVQEVREAFEMLKTDIKNAAYIGMHLDFLVKKPAATNP